MGHVNSVLNIDACSPLAPQEEHNNMDRKVGRCSTEDFSGKTRLTKTGSDDSWMYRHGSMDKDHLYTTSVSWSSFSAQSDIDSDTNDEPEIDIDVEFESIDEKQEEHQVLEPRASIERDIKYQEKFELQKLEILKLRQENSSLKKQNEELQLEVSCNTNSKSKHQRKTTPIPMTHRQQSRPKLRNVATWSVADRKKQREALSPLVCPLPVPQMEKFPAPPPMLLQSSRLRCKSVNSMHSNASMADFDGNECEHGTLVTECAVIQRFMKALRWYAECDGDDDMLMKQIRAEKYGYGLIRDYHHILTKHLKSSDMVRHELTKNGTECKNIHSCKACRRHKKKRGQDRDEHIPFYIQCIESVHNYFLHNINISKRV